MPDSDKLRMQIVIPKAIINTTTTKKKKRERESEREKTKKLIVDIKRDTYVKGTNLSK